MARPASEPLTNIPPAARDTVASLLAAPTVPVKILVSGGIGTGKTATLAAIRAALREGGVAVMTRPPRTATMRPRRSSPTTRICSMTQICDRSGEWVTDPASTVVVAAVPASPTLRALAAAIERENPVVSLGALSPAEVTRLAAETLGGPPTSEIVRSLMMATAGLPFLVQPAIAAAGRPMARRRRALPAQAGTHPLAGDDHAGRQVRADRTAAPVDEPVLDTLLIVVAEPRTRAARRRRGAACRRRNAQILVDRARASGLIEPSHSPRSCDRYTAQSRRSSAPRATTTSKSHCWCRNSNPQRCRRISRCDWPNTGCATTGWPPRWPTGVSHPWPAGDAPRGCTGRPSTPARRP